MDVHFALGHFSAKPADSALVCRPVVDVCFNPHVAITAKQNMLCIHPFKTICHILPSKQNVNRFDNSILLAFNEEAKICSYTASGETKVNWREVRLLCGYIESSYEGCKSGKNLDIIIIFPFS